MSKVWEVACLCVAFLLLFSFEIVESRQEQIELQQQQTPGSQQQQNPESQQQQIQGSEQQENAQSQQPGEWLLRSMWEMACGPREEYSRCNKHCQRTCEHPEGPIACPLVCVGGCVCRPGFYRRMSDGCCVRPKGCPGQKLIN